MTDWVYSSSELDTRSIQAGVARALLKQRSGNLNRRGETP
jgi:hypothetical protein